MEHTISLGHANFLTLILYCSEPLLPGQREQSSSKWISKDKIIIQRHSLILTAALWKYTQKWDQGTLVILDNTGFQTFKRVTNPAPMH